MYTSREQSKYLIDAGIDPKSADMMVVAGRGKDPFKAWNPISKSIENCRKYEGKDYMPVWSDEALIDMLPREITNPKVMTHDEITGKDINLRYELNIKKRIIPGRGKFNLVCYTDPTDGSMCVDMAYLSPKLTDALIIAVVEILCHREKDVVNYVW
jgi:hypothetical protein